MSIDAMKQALAALEGWANHGEWVWPESALEQAKRNTTESITALRAAIEQAEEPVAYGYWNERLGWYGLSLQPGGSYTEPDRKPLYTNPPKRQWIGLTDEEVHEAFCHVEYETPNDWNTDPDDWCQQFARYIEAKLKEKNK